MTLPWGAIACGLAVCIWLIRLEARVMINKKLHDAKLEALDVKIENHKELSKEKHDLLFDKLDELGKTMQAMQISLAKMTEHFTK